jgi:branched-chain amino acid transport system substrate-binding protein
MRIRVIIAAAISLSLLACTPAEPIRIGFLGGLTGRAADVGEAGRNGVQLAIEQRNERGGIKGRTIELITRDDAQDRDVTAKSTAELLAEDVEAVIGPFSSAMAAAALPLVNNARVVMVSPTVTSMDFYGNDDYLFRINRTTRDNAQDYAAKLMKRGQRRIAVAYDIRNRSFTESWYEEFRAALTAIGGEISTAVTFESMPDTGFGEVIEEMIASRPQGLVFIAAAIDLVRLAEQAKHQAPELPMAAAEWAASEKLIELGGKALEGLLIVQNFNREDTSPQYRAFRDAYFKRFQRDPGYSSVLAYDAANVVFDAMEKRTANETLKQALVKYAPFQGLHEAIAFDKNGDTPRTVFFTEIRNGRYAVIN